MGVIFSSPGSVLFLAPVNVSRGDLVTQSAASDPLASKLIKLITHILSHGFAFDHYDPGKPAWSGEPSDVVLDGNRYMVENVKVKDNLMVRVSEPKKSLALGIESEIDTEEPINEIDEMKFDPKIASTDKKTGDGSDNKDNDEEILHPYW